MQQKQLPIGYYLKLADNFLTKGIDDIQSQHGLNRVEWQVLNSIYERPESSKTEIIELMKPLANNQLVENIFAKLIDKNQVEVKNNTLTLTAEGKKYTNRALKLNKNLEKKRSRIFQKQITKPQF